MRQSRKKILQPEQAADEKVPAKVRMEPLLTEEDRAEQLLLEYQDTPNPDLMLYFYKSGPKTWLCPCGRQNKQEEAFCGHCGVSRQWLEEHCSDRYLAEQIIARKGAAAVRWKETLPEPSADKKIRGERPGPERPSLQIRTEALAETRLDGFFGGKLSRFWLYMVRFGTPRRRWLVLLTVLATALLAAGLLIQFSQ